jgi:glycosyltransferase involved in cell wall biosynthesis
MLRAFLSQMPKLEDPKELESLRASATLLPVSVIVAARNEERNLPRCLESLREFGGVYVIDSQSTDSTVEIAKSYGAHVVQFHYQGGWPKKRQWAMDSLPLTYDWILLIDADEALSPELVTEIQQAIQNPQFDAYCIALKMFFLGRELRHSGASFDKLLLFRRGKAHFECRLNQQDESMADMEVHEHVVPDSKNKVGKLHHSLLHQNVESLSHYIQKHDKYSNWDARVWFEGDANARDLSPALFGSQAQRRRWLRKKFFSAPGSPVLFFLYKYIFCLGFLDGIPGLIYCCFQGIQFFHIKAKIYELKTMGIRRGQI